MPNYFSPQDYTLAELRAQLAANEAEYDQKAISWHNYTATKNQLETAIIDKQTGPLKRRVREAFQPFSNRISRSEWVKFQCDLTALRSKAAVYEFYRSWAKILDFRKIAALPDLEMLDKAKAKPMDNRYDHAA